MNKNLKEVLTQAIIIVFFIGVSFLYFSPIIQGKVIQQMDYDHAKGVGNETISFTKANDRDVAWTNSLFGGMPSYQVGGISNNNIYDPIRRFFTQFLPYATVSTFFMYLLGFYILLQTFKVNKWASIIGALAFALSSYNIIIIAAGHVTKTYAIAFMPIVIAGFIQIYEKKYWLGVVLTLLGLGLQISTSHIQIIYYTGLLIGLYVVYKFIINLLDKKMKDFAISSAIALVVATLTILPNTGTLWRAYEMGKYSIRGESEITLNQDDNQGRGLDKDYALAWSYGIPESFSLLIPNINGGGNGQIADNEVAVNNISGQYADFVKQLDTYWGDQPFTSGPVYVGAIIMFLFVLGMFIVDDKIKWWLLAATVLSIMLSWGKNFGLLTDLFFYNFPFYNKFRTVSMILVVASVTIPLMALLTLKEILKDKNIIKTNLKYFGIAFGLTGGLALIFWLMPNIFSFSGQSEAQIISYLQAQNASQDIINEIIGTWENAKIAIFKADAIRSFAFILIAAALLFFYSTNNKLTKITFIFILGAIIFADMWTVDRRYLNNDDFMTKSKAKTNFIATSADNFIVKDNDPYYRVLNLSTSTFNDAFTSYFHKSIGGYHGAKLRRYQDIVDFYIQNEMQYLINSFQDTSINEYDALAQLQVLNMLNTKYVIYNPNAAPLINIHSFGNAWFVDNYKFVENANDEILAIETVNLKRTAIINKNKFNTTDLPEIGISNDTTRTITLTKYEPDNLEFIISSTKGGFVVFSDIYYPEGWIATIDDADSEIYQTNYILRGMYIPAGQHTVKFDFRPAAVYTAKKIELVGSIIIAILLATGLFFLVKQYLNKPILEEESDIKK